MAETVKERCTCGHRAIEHERAIRWCEAKVDSLGRQRTCACEVYESNAPAPKSITLPLDGLEETIARALLEVQVGPLGPNALDIVKAGGAVHLNGKERDDIAHHIARALAGDGAR